MRQFIVTGVSFDNPKKTKVIAGSNGALDYDEAAKIAQSNSDKVGGGKDFDVVYVNEVTARGVVAVTGFSRVPSDKEREELEKAKKASKPESKPDKPQSSSGKK